ncbi:hypothetical protein ACWEWI_39125 [Streptomyces sp. NPDC003753]
MPPTPARARRARRTGRRRGRAAGRRRAIADRLKHEQPADVVKPADQ